MEIQWEVKYSGIYRLIATFLHAAGAVHFFMAVFHYFDFNFKVAVSDFDRFGWAFKFLITWAAIFQEWYFVSALVIDGVKFGSHFHEPPAGMLTYLAYVKSCFAFPSSLAITLPFWSVYIFTPDYIYSSEDNEKSTPIWLLHMMATNTVLFMIADTIVTKCEYPRFSVCSVVIFFLYSSYVTWMFIIKIATDIWLYPIFGKMTFVKKILVFIAGYVVYLGCHLGSKLFNNLFWDESFSRSIKQESEARLNSEEVELKAVLSKSEAKPAGWFESTFKM